jgi:DNA-binding NarL/FixJ family response regulator
MSAGTNPIRILAVDDHSMFRQRLAAVLAAQPDMTLVAEASIEKMRSTSSTLIARTSP